jgi:hypothetical protein
MIMKNSAFKTIGGVTPFKKGEKGAGSGKTQVRKVRAGTEGTKARTNKAQKKSGYSTPGADYINVHAFGPNTRVSDSLESTLGPSLSPAVRGMSNFGETPEIDPNGSSTIDDGIEEAGIEEKHIPGQESSGNRFWDACHDANGERLPVGSTGTTTWVDENGETQSKSFLCKWGGTSTGAHNYQQKKTDGKDMERKYKVVNNKREYEINNNTDSEGWYEKN